MHAGNGDKERGRKAEVHSCQSQEPDAVLATTPRSLYRRFNSRPLARLPLTTVVARKKTGKFRNNWSVFCYTFIYLHRPLRLLTPYYFGSPRFFLSR